MDSIQRQDIDEFVENFKYSDKLACSRFLITGATGLVGASLINCLLALNKEIMIYAPVRNLTKALCMFEHSDHLKFIECDLVKYNYNSIGDVDYIIHCAAPTSSKFFVEHPVETYNIITKVSQALLEYAREHVSVKSFVFLSSLEVYGTIFDDSISLKEEMQGYLDPMNVRSSYPMAKRVVENLCYLYYSEFNVPVKVARLTQTTGAGVAKDDNRVIVQFARLASKGEDIVLYTTGEAARPYCYIVDCVSAILYILLNGVNGDVYNVANDSTYISAKQMAEFVKNNFNQNVNLLFDLKSNNPYAPVTKLKLSTEKLYMLGWRPRYGLYDIFSRIIAYIKKNE